MIKLNNLLIVVSETSTKIESMFNNYHNKLFVYFV